MPKDVRVRGRLQTPKGPKDGNKILCICPKCDRPEKKTEGTWLPRSTYSDHMRKWRASTNQVPAHLSRDDGIDLGSCKETGRDGEGSSSLAGNAEDSLRRGRTDDLGDSTHMGYDIVYDNLGATTEGICAEQDGGWDGNDEEPLAMDSEHGTPTVAEPKRSDASAPEEIDDNVDYADNDDDDDPPDDTSGEDEDPESVEALSQNPDHNNEEDEETDEEDEDEEEEEEELDPNQETYYSRIPTVDRACRYIAELQNASLDNDKITPEVLDRLRNPLTTPLDISEPETRLAFETFLGLSNGADILYNNFRRSYLRCHPNSDILSHDQIKSRLTELSGVEPILYDMCRSSCVAFTGPLAELTHCPEKTCRLPRYNPETGVAYRQFKTFPIGPMLQAMFRSKHTAEALQYRAKHTRITEEYLNAQEAAGQTPSIPKSFDDVFSGLNYMRAVQRGEITEDTITLMLSIDGAQLYAYKESTFWIFVWVVLDFPPDVRYKKDKVLIAAIVPGPTNPKDTDSFLFPSLHHVAALQKDGLRVWDASTETIRIRKPLVPAACADGPAMAYLNGLLGHKGYKSCRLWCPMLGRRFEGPRYYPVHLKPLGDYAVAGSCHDDVDLLEQPNASEDSLMEALKIIIDSAPKDYKKNRKQLGISKPSILAGLPYRLALTQSFAPDIMHLLSINLPDLFLKQWRGKMACHPKDDISTWTWAVLRNEAVWAKYGKMVAAATPYIPSIFGRVPGNIAENLNSGFKACQHGIHFYGLAPALLKGILPDTFHVHLCQLVKLAYLIERRRKAIKIEEVADARTLAANIVYDYEKLYYQRKKERIHFCPPCIHLIAHLPIATVGFGPLSCMSQWTTERTIGNITREVRQPSNPMANIAERSQRRNQTNILIAMDPLLSSSSKTPLPKGAHRINDGYVLLRARERSSRPVHCQYAHEAIRKYIGKSPEEMPFIPVSGGIRMQRWARLHLPNGQISRSLWGESLKKKQKPRRARNVKIVSSDGHTQYAEVQFYFLASQNGEKHGAALVSLYSEPFQKEFDESHGVLYLSKYSGKEGYAVVEVKYIQSLVAMIPFPGLEEQEIYYKVEKLGIDVEMMGGVYPDY